MTPKGQMNEERPIVAARAARVAGVLFLCLVAVGLLTLAGTAAADLSAPPVRWERAAYPGSVDLSAVTFHGGATGFATGASGAILVSHDGGASWAAASVSTTADLQGVCVDPAGGVHAVGAHGVSVSSSDARSWAVAETGSGADLNDVDFGDPAHGCAVGSAGTILVTSDAGATWATSAAGVDASATLLGVDFFDPLVGWAWGSGGVVCTTHDGGASWTPLTVAAEATLSAGCFVSATEGWVAGSTGLLAHTVDGGDTWAFCSAPVTGTILALDFCDPLHGVLLADQGLEGTAIASTADGGATWDVVRQPEALRGVAISDGLHAWAVGTAGSILRTTGADAPAMAVELAPALPPGVTVARAMPDGAVLIGWSDVPGASGYVVRRSLGGGTFDTLATLIAGEAPGLRDDTLSEGDAVAYTVSARFGGIESVPGPVAAAKALSKPAEDEEDPTPSDMSCTDCHVVHATDPDGNPAAQPLWCLDCHPALQRTLAGADAATRHDLLAGDAGEGRLGLSCTDCHSAHASSETTPLIDPDRPGIGLATATEGFCLACHDGQLTEHVVERDLAFGMATTTPADIAAGWGSPEQTTSADVHGYGPGEPRLRPGAGAQAGAVLPCVECHDAHGSTNRWSLRESIAPDAATGAHTGLLVEPLDGGGADLRLFCAGCHLLDLHPSVASGGADLTRWPIDCTGCHRHGSGL
jgi:photosystem II stability/assembly factor-like uncharacterized protein